MAAHGLLDRTRTGALVNELINTGILASLLFAAPAFCEDAPRADDTAKSKVEEPTAGQSKNG